MNRNHFHPYHELIAVVEGEVVFAIGGGEVRARSGSLVLINHLEHHEVRDWGQGSYRRYVATLTHEFCLLLVQEPLLLSLLLHRPAGFCNVIQLSPPVFTQVQRLFERLWQECRDKRPLWSVQCALLLSQLLLVLYRMDPALFPGQHHSHGVSTAVEVQRYVWEHLGQAIRLDDLADHFFVSKYHLSRNFHKITGYQFQQYLTLCRMQQAKRLLCATDLSVTEIGQRVGYGGLNHFVRTFRQREGTSPGQYRKQMRLQPPD